MLQPPTNRNGLGDAQGGETLDCGPWLSQAIVGIDDGAEITAS